MTEANNSENGNPNGEPLADSDREAAGLAPGSVGNPQPVGQPIPIGQSSVITGIEDGAEPNAMPPLQTAGLDKGGFKSELEDAYGRPATQPAAAPVVAADVERLESQLKPGQTLVVSAPPPAPREQFLTEQTAREQEAGQEALGRNRPSNRPVQQG